MTKDDILQVLYTVIDPEIGINLVDLGLIYDIEINDAFINITMTLTTPGCPMHESMVTWVQNVVQKKAPEKEVNVNLVWEPAWTPSRMTEAAKNQLGY